MAEYFSTDFSFATAREPFGIARLASHLGCFVSLSLLSACLAQEQPKEIQAERIADLVVRLGNSEFAARESAMELLAQSDEKLLPELEHALDGLTNDDLEARARLSGIIARIKNDRKQKQIRGFLRSIDQTETQGFEGWRSFSQVSGTNRNSKKLFLMLLDTYPELVFAELKSKKEALDKARDIAATINQSRMDLRGYEVPDALAMLYCLNVADDLTDRSLEKLSAGTFGMAPFSQFMTDPQSRKSLERLMSGWSNRLEEELLRCLMLFVEKDYPQAKDVALKLLESDQIKTEPFAFIRSMQAIYRYGSQTDLPKIEKWLDDKTVYFRFPDQGFGNQFPPLGPPQSPPKFQPQPPLPPPSPPVVTAEFRDIALLVSMHLANQDVTAEFPRLQPMPPWGFREESLFLPQDSDLKRTNRIENWKAKRKTSEK